MRQLRDAIAAAPQAVLDRLPASARETLDGMKRQIDELLQPVGQRLVGNTLVLDANRGATFTRNGRTQAIGDTPPVVQTNGRTGYQNVDGNPVPPRAPATYDRRVANADGSVTYFKGGDSVRYDANGFPVFNAKADLLLDASHIGTRSDADHFRAANTMLGDALRADGALADTLGLTSGQVAYLTRQPPSSASPPGLTWHHHQDTGRMQLVVRSEHALFPGGHVGGMRLWGGGR